MEELYTTPDYIMYLRKSRKDGIHESEEEVLARHEHLLFEAAERLKIPKSKIKIMREVVSGESIKARPKMQELLREIENPKIKGVLCVEIERLARGDTLDQGTVSRTFKLTNTLIITPGKIYDPNNEADEEYFEFGLFMSRKEYKTINRRLQTGRMQSVLEGKYVCSHAPFGYDRQKLIGQKGYTLVPNHDADTVRLIFDLFTEQRMGTQIIAHYLNDRGIKPLLNDFWTTACVRNTLTRAVYKGKIVWNRRKRETTLNNGALTESRPVHKDYVEVDGLHEPLVSEEQFDKAQMLLKPNPSKNVPSKYPIMNPLAGICHCGVCGHSMSRRPGNSKTPTDSLMCSVPRCSTVSSNMDFVIERLLQTLQNILDEQRTYLANYESKEKSRRQLVEKNINSMQREHQALTKQLTKVYDSYEKGIYSDDDFISRRETINKKISSLESEIEKAHSEINNSKVDAYRKSTPQIEKVLTLYPTLSPPEQNVLLKTIIKDIIYHKDKKGNPKNRYNCDKFTLDIQLKSFY